MLSTGAAPASGVDADDEDADDDGDDADDEDEESAGLVAGCTAGLAEEEAVVFFAAASWALFTNWSIS